MAQAPLKKAKPTTAKKYVPHLLLYLSSLPLTYNEKKIIKTRSPRNHPKEGRTRKTAQIDEEVIIRTDKQDRTESGGESGPFGVVGECEEGEDEGEEA